MVVRPSSFVVLALLLAGGPGSAAAGGPGEYRQALRTALVELERGGPAAAERAAMRLRAVGPIDLPGGASVHPDNSAILADLETQPPDRAGAQARLRALIAELDRALAPRRAEWGPDPRGRLKQVLDRPEFGPEPPPDPVTRFVGEQWKALASFLSRALFTTSGGPSALDLRSLLAVVGLMAVVGIVAYVIRGIRQTMGPDVVGAASEEAARVLTAEAARAEAGRLARAGAFRAAVHAHYLAALLHYEETGRLRFDRSLTNREVLARARAQGDAALVRCLGPLAERFDRLWYGGVSCSEEDYVGFARLAGQAWEAA